MLHRLVGFLVVIVATTFGAPATAMAAPSTFEVTYSYNSPNCDGPLHPVSPERGPPASGYDCTTTHTAADATSHGASARLHTVAAHACDSATSLGQVDSSGTTTCGRACVINADTSPLWGARDAANKVDDLAHLTTSQQRAVRSLQRQIDAHRSKLDDYIADPDAYDNLGYLERAPTPEIRQRIIDGRINHLETEIRTFQDQIDKLLGGGQ